MRKIFFCKNTKGRNLKKTIKFVSITKFTKIKTV